MADHTPTPWSVIRVHGDVLGIGVSKTTNLGTFSEKLFGVVNLNPKNRKRDEANAAIICKAVNVHDELVAALTYLVAEIDAQSTSTPLRSLDFHVAKSVLAKIKETSK